MRTAWTRKFLLCLSGLLLSAPGCTAGSRPAAPTATATQELRPVALLVTVPEQTVRLEVHATNGTFTAGKVVASFAAATLRTLVQRVASLTLELPLGSITLHFQAFNAQLRVVGQFEKSVEVLATGTNTVQVALTAVDQNPAPGVSPSPGGPLPPPFLGGPGASASPVPGTGSSASPTLSPGTGASTAPTPAPSTGPSAGPTATPTTGPTPTPTPTPSPGLRAFAVTTLAGNGTAGFVDGNGTNASFHNPSGVTVDNTNNVYVADFFNNAIRKVTPAGAVTTVAGNGSAGFADGTGTAASFFGPLGVAVDGNGNVFVADCLNNLIRKITPGGVVTTVAGNRTAGFVDGTGTASEFSAPRGIAIESNGIVYVADTENQRIRQITPAGVVTTIAGNGSRGSADGTGTEALLNYPEDVALDGNGNLYVMDTGNNRLRKITPAGVVTTVAGSDAGFADGTGTAALFNLPVGLVIDGSNNIFIADTSNHRIRQVTPAGAVTTVAGNGSRGYADGTGTATQFDQPYHIGVDSSGYLYVGDAGNHRIRIIR